MAWGRGRSQHHSWEGDRLCIGQYICRFGIPRTLISNNGKQFECNSFREFTKNMKIWYKFSSVAHPQINSKTKETKRAILQGLKKQLDGLRRIGHPRCPTSCGHFIPHLGNLLERLHLCWHLEQKSWYLWSCKFQHTEYSSTIKTSIARS